MSDLKEKFKYNGSSKYLINQNIKVLIDEIITLREELDVLKSVVEGLQVQAALVASVEEPKVKRTRKAKAEEKVDEFN